MLGHPSRKTLKILDERGVTAPATLREVERGSWAMNLHGSDPRPEATEFRCRVVLDVVPEGAEPFSVETHIAFPQTAIPQPGWGAQVKYDPEDHSRIVLVTDPVPSFGAMGGMAAGDGSGDMASQMMDLMKMALGGASPDEIAQRAQAIDGAVVQSSSVDIPLAGATPASAAVPQAAGGDDMASQLERLAALHQAGQLTDDEYTKAKQQLLEG